MLKKIKENIIPIALTLCFVIVAFLFYVRIVYLESAVNVMANNSTPQEVTVDFSNKAGSQMINSNFTNLLVSSEGSTKKGEGYVVNMKVVNPSSVDLKSHSFIYSWRHNGLSHATTITNPNSTLVSGSHALISAFLSPMEGIEIKQVTVSGSYEFMAYR